MSKIGIYVDYKHNETTLAAVMLANWMLRLGNCVRIISNGTVARNVDSYWDDRVLRDNFRNRNCYLDLSHVFWFYPDRLSYFVARFVGENNERVLDATIHAENEGKVSSIQHLYFPGWCNKSTIPNELLLNAKIVCLNRDSAIWLSSSSHDFELDQRWAELCSPDKLLVPKSGRAEKNKLKILTLLGSDFAQDIGNQLFDVFEDLLNRHAQLQVTFLLEKSLSRLQRNRLKKLKRTFENRVVLAGVMPYNQYHAMAYLHDWVYVACASFKHGALIPHLSVSGTPLICHDIPPARSYISSSLSGLLVPTKTASTFKPRGVVCFDSLLTTLKQAIEMNDLGLKGLQKNSYDAIKKKNDAFSRFLLQEVRE